MDVPQLLRDAALARREGRLDDATRSLEAALVRNRSGRVLAALGQIERDQHRIDSALRHYEEAAAIFRAEADTPGIAYAVRHLADIHREAGHADLALPCYHEALAIYRGDQQSSPLDLANSLRGLALLKYDAGDAEQARSLLREARDLYAALNVEAGALECSRYLARLP